MREKGAGRQAHPRWTGASLRRTIEGMSQPRVTTTGPFHTAQIRSGDPYELSQGHAVYCAPTGQEGAGPNGLGFLVLDSDPAVKRAGVDAGIALASNTLRAPDVAVGLEPGEGTWAKSAALALEYAGSGQDEADLRTKIRELLAGGTRWVWVVRLTGPRRVEVHERGKAVEVLGPGQVLRAPGVLRNDVPVEALYDREVAHEAALRNLLQRSGFDSIEAVREEGREEGREDGREEGAARVLAASAARRLRRALTPSELAALRALVKSRGAEGAAAAVMDADEADVVALLSGA